MVCPITGNEICKCAIKDVFRKLFTEHAVYTKFYIESALQSLPDLSVITTRLLQNQQDIGNALKSFVGAAKGDLATSLLQEHILAAAAVIGAIKAKDPAGINAAEGKLFANGQQVAEFLSSLKPDKLPYSGVLLMFNTHNQQVIDMTTLHVQGNYQGEYALYDKYYNHMLMLSDTLSKALTPRRRKMWLFIITFLILVILIFVIAKMMIH